MSKAEIMNCAAILAAGIIASGKCESCIGAEEAVALMNEIADAIRKLTKDDDIDYRVI